MLERKISVLCGVYEHVVEGFGRDVAAGEFVVDVGDEVGVRKGGFYPIFQEIDAIIVHRFTATDAGLVAGKRDAKLGTIGAGFDQNLAGMRFF